MAESFPPPVSCVYQIRCIPTGKIYIGSANNLRSRWQTHLRRLRCGRHENQPLQGAWNKYGEANFHLSILEPVPRDQLLRAEQAWLDGSGCTQQGVGFNLRPIASSAGESLWHVDRIRKRPYPNIRTWSGFVDPSGKAVAPITNLAAFSRKHGLVASHMIAVAAGRICSHQGWAHERGRRRAPPKTYTGFLSPTGQRVTITNLLQFCRDNALCIVHMHEVKNGTRRSHKGWTWRP